MQFTDVNSASEVLWNLLVRDGKTEEVRYRGYFDRMAKTPKNADLATMLHYTTKSEPISSA